MSQMMIVRESPRHWEVWIGLEGDPVPLSRNCNSFIIGVGQTRDEAVTKAVADLEALVDQLQQRVRTRA